MWRAAATNAPEYHTRIVEEEEAATRRVSFLPFLVPTSARERGGERGEEEAPAKGREAGSPHGGIEKMPIYTI